MDKLTAWLGILLLGCGSPPPVEPPATDTTQPVMVIGFPTDADEFDRDGDGLLEIVLTVTDDSLDLSSLTATSDGQDLLPFLETEWLEPDSLIISEAVHSPLSDDVTSIVVSLADLAGNRSRVTVDVALPAGSLHKSVVTGLNFFLPADGITMCPHDGLIYMTVQFHMVVIDPRSLEILNVAPPVGEANAGQQELTDPVCLPERQEVWVASILGTEIYEIETGRWWVGKVHHFGTYDVVRSSAFPHTIYAGEGGGAVGIYDVAARTRLGYLMDLVDGEIQGDLEILDNGLKLYVTPIILAGGITVVDPVNNQMLKRLDLSDGIGVVLGMALSEDNSRLYAAVNSGLPRGAYEIDTETDEVIRTLTPDHGDPIDVGVNAANTLLFMTTQNTPPGVSQNLLIDLRSWEVIAGFDRPREEGKIRFDRQVLFSPDGRMVFVTRDHDLDVYIIRRQ